MASEKYISLSRERIKASLLFYCLIHVISKFILKLEVENNNLVVK